MDKEYKKRFWAKVDKNAPNGCWEWTACRARGGYGNFWYKGTNIRANRLSAKWAGIDIENKHVLHTCDNPACVNPKHLFTGNNLINTLDKMKKGRYANGTIVYPKYRKSYH